MTEGMWFLNKNRKDMKTYYKLMTVAVMIAATFSCSLDIRTDNDWDNPNGSQTVLNFYSDPLKEHNVTTRSSDIKDEDEKRINSLHVFFFDADGNYLPGTYLEGYPGATKRGGYYSPGQGVTILKIANELNNFYDGDQSFYESAKSAIVYAVANVDDAFFRELNDYGRPKNVPDMAALEAMTYAPPEGISLGLPDAGMPMIGKATVDLTEDGASPSILLKALMARIDVNISLASDVSDGRLPAMTLVEWTAMNLPAKVAFKELGVGETTGSAWTDEWGKDGNPKDITTPLQRTIYNKDGSISFSFYMFENVQANKSITYPDDVYNQDLGIDKRQNYKPLCGADTANSAAVKLHAFYSTYNDDGTGSATYEVYYTLYLGANHTDDFRVERNHQYKNNITIKGLTAQSSQTGQYTFDARVEIDEDGNEFYIAMLRERNHDAHFCVTPMDVYLFADVEGNDVNPTMEVILGEVPDGSEVPSSIPPDWIRMELVCAEDMAEGTVTKSGFEEYSSQTPTGTHLATHKPWHAGNGKRAFFTNDLVTNTLWESGKKVTIENTRDRVYFYIDENLKLQDRSAVVTLIYKENGTEVKRRTLKIEQTHLLPVQLRDGQGTIYMERYEEYLDHYDPLDEYRTDQVYDGLPWAYKGSNLSSMDIPQLYRDYFVLTPLDPYDKPYLVINDGLAYTSFIIYLGDQNVMTLNQRPQSAHQYCHNKNKRNGQGKIDATYNIIGIFSESYIETSNSAKWFLPGIRQMEDALTQYYTTFGEFQDNYYWSCSAGEKEGYDSGQSSTQARATKVNPDGTYVESGGMKPIYPESGRAYRTEILRIRACRTDLFKPNY